MNTLISSKSPRFVRYLENRVVQVTPGDRFPPTLDGAQAALIAVFEGNPDAGLHALASVIRAHGAERVRDLPSDRSGAFIADLLSRFPVKEARAPLRAVQPAYRALRRCRHSQPPHRSGRR